MTWKSVGKTGNAPNPLPSQYRWRYVILRMTAILRVHHLWIRDAVMHQPRRRCWAVGDRRIGKDQDYDQISRFVQSKTRDTAANIRGVAKLTRGPSKKSRLLPTSDVNANSCNAYQLSELLQPQIEGQSWISGVENVQRKAEVWIRAARVVY